MNILSFDLDFIFPKMDEINEFDEDNFKASGLEHLNSQAFFLFELILKKEKNYKIIKSHEEILELIPFTQNINLYNIDNHCDIYYVDEQKSAIDLCCFEHLDKEDKEACWVYELYRITPNLKYTWIGHDTSELVKENLELGFRYFYKEGSSLNPFGIWEEIKDIEFDLVVFCESSNYMSQIQIEYCREILKGGHHDN